MCVGNSKRIELIFKAAEKLHNSSDFCQRSGPSLETSDVTLVSDDGKRVEAHKDKMCRGSADSENYYKLIDSSEFETRAILPIRKWVNLPFHGSGSGQLQNYVDGKVPKTS